MYDQGRTGYQNQIDEIELSRQRSGNLYQNTGRQNMNNNNNLYRDTGSNW